MRAVILGILLCFTMTAAHVEGAKEQAKSHHHAKGLKRDQKKFKEFKKAKHRRLKRSVSIQIPATGGLSQLPGIRPRNQGQCGSCWAYGLTKSLQYEYVINNLPLPSLPDVSYLIGNCGGPVDEGGCNGGDFPAGQNFLKGLGAWGGGVDPASGRCQKLAPIITATNFVMLGDGQNPPTDYELTSALQKHVLAIDIAADNSWGNYPSGAKTINGLPVWNRTTSTGIDHIINRVDYICTNTVPCQAPMAGQCCAFDSNDNSAGIIYLDLNNWDESWGTKGPNGVGGFIYETRLANQAGQSASYFEIDLPPPPVPVPVPVPPAPVPPEPETVIPIWVLYIAGGIAVALGVVGFLIGRK